MRIFVGNLARSITSDHLSTEFGAYGQVVSAEVVKDRYSGESKGFGFVEMPSKNEAHAAINALNLKDIDGRSITVSEARPRNEAPRGGGRPGRR